MLGKSFSCEVPGSEFFYKGQFKNPHENTHLSKYYVDQHVLLILF